MQITDFGILHNYRNYRNCQFLHFRYFLMHAGCFPNMKAKNVSRDTIEEFLPAMQS